MEKLVMDEAALSEKLAQCETFDEAYAALRDAGVEMSEEEFARAVAIAQADELSEDALDDVAGGGKIRSAFKQVVDLLKRINRPLSPIWPKRRW